MDEEMKGCGWGAVKIYIGGQEVQQITDFTYQPPHTREEVAMRLAAHSFSFNIPMTRKESRKLYKQLMSVGKAKKFRLPRKLKKKLKKQEINDNRRNCPL